MSELSCPYCNTPVPVTRSIPAGEMIFCPRCEERFRALQSVNVTTTPTGSGVPAPPRPPGRSTAPTSTWTRVLNFFGLNRKFSNRAVALTVLGVMAVMAAGTTIFALQTQQDRRDNDKGLRNSRTWKRPRQPDLEEERIAVKAPREMDALKCLPGDMDALAGVHVAAVLQDSEGRGLLDRDVPALGGSVGSQLKRLGEVTGIDCEDVDHLVLGGRLDGQTLMLAVRMRDDLDREKIIKHLGASARGRGSDATWTFSKELLPWSKGGAFTFADDRTIVFTSDKDGTGLARARKADSEPAPEIAALLREQMKPAGPVWLAGHVDAKYAPVLEALLALGKVPEVERKVLAGVRSFALWLTLEQKATLRGAVKASDAAAAEGVETYLRGRFGNRDGVTLIREKELVLLQSRAAE